MNLDSWFLGFYEADGCFTYNKGSCPILSMDQQDDMGCMPPATRLMSILIGGTTNQIQTKAKRKDYDTKYKPTWKAFARSKDALLNAVWFFDQNQLISVRKQRDYNIWRQMALLYIMNGRSADQLPYLAAELSSDGRTKYVV